MKVFNILSILSAYQKFNMNNTLKRMDDRISQAFIVIWAKKRELYIVYNKSLNFIQCSIWSADLSQSFVLSYRSARYSMKKKH